MNDFVIESVTLREVANWPVLYPQRGEFTGSSPEITTEVYPERIRFRFGDFRVGMSPEAVEQIGFNPFAQLSWRGERIGSLERAVDNLHRDIAALQKENNLLRRALMGELIDE